MYPQEAGREASVGVCDMRKVSGKLAHKKALQLRLFIYFYFLFPPSRPIDGTNRPELRFLALTQASQYGGLLFIYLFILIIHANVWWQQMAYVMVGKCELMSQKALKDMRSVYLFEFYFVPSLSACVNACVLEGTATLRLNQ